MTDSALTHVYVLLDRSGSMSSIADDTVGGFAAFVRDQQAVAGRCKLSLAQSSRAGAPPCTTPWSG